MSPEKVWNLENEHGEELKMRNTRNCLLKNYELKQKYLCKIIGHTVENQTKKFLQTSMSNKLEMVFSYQLPIPAVDAV